MVCFLACYSHWPLFGQEQPVAQKDSAKQKLITLNEVILSGKIKRDPVFSVVF
jgi:iron complex outermembrane receptor protein